MNYKLKLTNFEGPLDLLLYLIKKNDIEITDIPIVEVTEQYMQHIEMMKMLDLDIVGDFLVMAATLMQIKSRMLLPPDPTEVEEEEVDPRDELVRRLNEYKQFKEAAEDLEHKSEERRKFFVRRFDVDEQNQIKDDAREVYFEANLFDLMSAFSEAIKRINQDGHVHRIVEEEFTLEEKIDDILQVLVHKPSIHLGTVFKTCRSKMEVIVTFLAVLELIRIKEIQILQKRLFADIEIHRNKDSAAALMDES